MCLKPRNAIMRFAFNKITLYVVEDGPGAGETWSFGFS